MMQAGRLRHQITIQENQSTAKDDYGAPVENWVDVWSCRASVEPLSGREYFASQQVQAEQVTRFRIRYARLQIWPGMRIKYRDNVLNKDRYFNIDAVIDPNEMHVELSLMATEQVKPLAAAAVSPESSP